MLMPTADLVVRGGLVFDAANAPHSGYRADIHVAEGRIAAIHPADDRAGGAALDEVLRHGARLIDARRRLVMPGFVNAHYHSADVLLKGCFEPSPLELWVLDALPQSYRPRSRDEIRVRTLLGAVECIRGGITTAQDMVTLLPFTAAGVETLVDAYTAVGLRTILGLSIADVSPLEAVPFWREQIPAELQMLLAPPAKPRPPIDTLHEIEAEIVTRRGRHPLVTWALAPTSPDRCTDDVLRRVAEIAERQSLPVYSHIYISKAEAVGARRRFAAAKGSLIERLRAAGLLGPRLTLAHGVWLSPPEIDAIAAAGASIALNPVSNLKNKNGVAPIRQLIAAGINLALGCDNCSCTDAQNIFQAMKMFALLAAVSDPAPGPPDAVDAIHAATVGGARTAGLADELGAIHVGMAADLVLLDLDDPAFVPLNSVARQVVYGECGRGVDSVIVGGRVVMANRKIETIDEEGLRREATAIHRHFKIDAEAVFARSRKLAPHVLAADARSWATDIGLNRYVGSG